MKKLIFAAVVFTCAAQVAQAGTIERACLSSDRRAASRSLCNCIQRAADMTLTYRDQRTASKFFKDPHKAQEVRQSGGTSNEAFWRRYKAFGQTAQASCG
jgi:hypothetical protein